MPIRTLVSRLAVGVALALAVAPLGGQASALGQWSPVFGMDLVAVHAALMRTGELLLFDAWEIPGTPSARLWNPETNAYTPVPNGFAELFCAGHILTSDGRLLTAGGHNGSGVGTTDTTLFDPATRQWTSLPDLNYARWYPSLVQLADGRALTLGGAISRPNNAEYPETFSTGASAWTARPAAQKDVGEYPLVFPGLGGRIFVNGFDSTFRSWLFDVGAGTWQLLGVGPAAGGAGVMYRAGKVMMTGGGTPGVDPVTTATGVIDLAATPPVWRSAGPMAFGRSQHNLVLLPDGQVLVVGGAAEISLVSTNPVLTPEIWNPDTERWTQVAPMARPRMYHSIAILLPDGRVLAAGGGRLGPNEQNGEFYSPPYLFRGGRPVVTSAPASVSYGAPFQVGSSTADAIARMTLVRASSVTHGLNLDQRFFELSFTRSGSTLTVWAPSDPDAAPAGDYLLFALNAEGVPSIARVVRLSGSAGPTSLVIDDATANEGTAAAGSLVFTVSLTSASAQTVTVNYATAGGSAQPGSDYLTRTGTLNFPPGTVTRTIVVPTVADDLIEPNESFSVLLSNAANASIGDGTGLGTIVNDDVPAIPPVSINSVGVSEDSVGTPVAAFTVSLSNAPALNGLVSFRTVNGSATAPADYTSTTGTLTFAGGTTVQTIQVPIVPDLLPEADEVFTVELFNPVNLTLGTASGTATILDDDTPGRPVTKSFVVTSGADDVNEDGATLTTAGGAWVGTAGSAASYLGLRFTGVSIPAGATVAAARLELTAASTQWLSIGVELAAEASPDSAPFSATSRPSARPLTASRVQYSADVQWLADTRYPLNDVRALVQDVVNQPAWSAGRALSLVVRGTGAAWARKHIKSADGATADAPRLVITYATPVPPPPNLPPLITAVSAAPASGTAPLMVGFTAVATDPEGAPLTYSWNYGDGATGSGPTPTHLYATAGAYSATLAVSDGTHVVTAGPIAVSVTAPAVLAVSISGATATEGHAGTTPVAFAVALSAPSAGMVTVNYATADGTGIAPADYVAASGTVTFPPGSTSQTIAVGVVGDTAVEANETFAVALSGAAGASIAQGVGTGIILNDDAPVPGSPAPRDLVATTSRNTVHFIWQPPAAGGPVHGYLLEAGFQPGQTLLAAPLGADPSFTTAAPDGIYYVRVRALLDGGPGPASNEVRVALGAAAPPLSPSALLATVQGVNVTLQWSENPMGPTVTGYELHAGTAAGLADLGVTPAGAPSRGLSVDVAPGTYFVRVLAVNAAGSSLPSNEAVITTGAGICTTPAVPSGLAAHSAAGVVSVGWSPAAVGAIPLRYELRVGRTSGVADFGVLTLPAAVTALSGPVPPGTYYLQVAAVDACGASAPSTEIAVIVP